MEGYIKSEIKNQLGIVSFFHPAHNSLPSILLKELRQAIKDADDNEDVKIILIKSEGEKTFCSGASFTELSSLTNEEESKSFFMGFANVINEIRLCKKIVIGRIHGKAIGGGVGLASACDYALASKYSSIRLSELAVGIGPFVIGPAVERKVGLSAFSQMALSPEEWQTAEWAKQKGLFQEAFDSVEQLDAYIDHFIEKLLSYNPEALAELKKIFWKGTEQWDVLLAERAGISGKLLLGEFSKNAINKFLNR
jgi:methylglutaconyl-CoA hydratase